MVASAGTDVGATSGTSGSAPRSRRRASWAGPAALAWSLAYGALGIFWALGGAGFPFGEGDPGGADWMSPLSGVRAEVGGPVIAGLGAVGAAVALAMGRSWGRGVPRGVLLGFGWAMTAALLLVVPDARVLAVLGYLPALVFALGFDEVDWPMWNQGLCMAGGFAWGAATLAYGRQTRAGAGHEDEVAAAIAGARWRRLGRWATGAAVVLPLPYAATRLAWAAGLPLGLSGEFRATFETDGAQIAEVSLGGMALGGALLTLGLAQRWGEVFPRWVPGLGGRRVPPALAIAPATTVSVALIGGGTTMFRLYATGNFDAAGWGAATPALAFLPWGVALGLATLAYHRRRRGRSIDRDHGERPLAGGGRATRHRPRERHGRRTQHADGGEPAGGPLVATVGTRPAAYDRDVPIAPRQSPRR